MFDQVENGAEAKMDAGELGVVCCGFLKVVNGFFVIPFAVCNQAEFEMCIGECGIALQGLMVVICGFVDAVELVISIGQFITGNGIIRVGLDGLAKLRGDCFKGLGVLIKKHAG